MTGGPCTDAAQPAAWHVRGGRPAPAGRDVAVVFPSPPGGVLRGPRSLIVLGLLALLWSGCESPPESPLSPEELALIQSLSPPPPMPPSPTNRFADDPKAADLGHALFFDARLSANGKVSCSTCHAPELYFADGKPLAEGVGKVSMHSPTLFGSHYGPFQFWDGRADSSWSQALGPLEAPNEHGMTRLSVAHQIALNYAQAYTSVFGPLPELADGSRFPPSGRPHPLDPAHPEQLAWGSMTDTDRDAVNRVYANVGKAIEAYTRKIVPGAAPFDAYVAATKAGDPTGGGHLSPQALRGVRAFVGEAQCINCHNGPLLTDFAFHNLGLPGDRLIGRSKGASQVLKNEFNCNGDYSDAAGLCDELTYLDPAFEDFRGAFKTPSLRNVAKTAPYMHAGQFGDLPAVIDFYKSLPDEPKIGHRELVLTLLSTSVSTEDLVAFLESLTGPLPDEKWTRPPGPRTP
jgi:cytochrome c peroxidase